MIRVRPYVPADREFVLSLTPRLAIGIPSWRDTHKMAVTAQSWIIASIEQHGNQTMVFVAEEECTRWGAVRFFKRSMVVLLALRAKGSLVA